MLQLRHDDLIALAGKDEEEILGHPFPEYREGFARQIGRAPFAVARVHVEFKEDVEMRLGDVSAGDVAELKPFLSLRALLAQVLALRRREFSEKRLVVRITAIDEVELLVGADQPAIGFEYLVPK